MTAQRTALIVDDMKAMRTMMRTWLSEAGFYSIECGSAREALSRLGTVTPSVILLDVNMPGIDGYELCAMIRLDYPHVRCPILFVTSNRSAGDVVEARRCGGDYFVVKPFTKEALISGLKKAATARRKAMAA